MKHNPYGPTKCSKCGKPHGLSVSDAGTQREIHRLCYKCFKPFECDTCNGYGELSKPPYDDSDVCPDCDGTGLKENKT